MRIWLAYVVRDSERAPRMLVSAGSREMAETIVRERLGWRYGSEGGGELVLVAAAVCPESDVEIAIQRDLDGGAP